MLPCGPHSIERLLDYPLYPDSMIQWTNLNHWILSTERGLEYKFPQCPFLHYVEFLGTLNMIKKLGHDFKSRVINESDPDAVIKFNRLVDEFNEQSVGIRDGKNINMAKSFVERAKKIIYGEVF